MELPYSLPKPSFFRSLMLKMPEKSGWRQFILVFAHVLFWACYISLPLLLMHNPAPTDNTKLPTLNTNNLPDQYFYPVFFAINFLSILLFYANTELLMPRFLSKKKGLIYASGVICVLMVALVINYYFRSWIVGTPPRTFVTLTTFYLFMSVIGISTCYRLLTDYQRDQRLQTEREKIRLQAELSFLRSQISPHFMFNLMNSLAALARKKSDLLEPMIVKMSDLLRYMLYDSDETRVPLDKEINYLKSYVDLQKLRFGNHVKVEMEVETPANGIALEPMLLIPFVENAFKHGTGYLREPFIQISLKTEGKKLFFVVKNRFNPESKETKDSNSGIGLANVRRRLELMYEENHALLVHTKKDLFITELTIDLK